MSALMKALFITVLIVAGIFLGYDFFLAPPHERMIFEKGPAPVPPGQKSAPAEAVATRTPAQPASAPQSPPPPAPAASSDDFVAPAIASLEEATQNWTQIPERAFPRPVVIKQPVEIRMSAGSGQLAAGASVIALSAEAGTLTITPSEGSTARGTLPVTATDLPEQIQPAYEKWRSHRIELARLAWEARRRGDVQTAALADQIDLEGKPVPNSSGGYDLLLASMRAGQVNEIRPDNVLAWGRPHPGVVDGKPGWLIEVQFHTLTLFGPFDVVAQAQIRDGKVVRWLYPGSGEPVP